jgi:hypothetical protein
MATTVMVVVAAEATATEAGELPACLLQLRLQHLRAVEAASASCLQFLKLISIAHHQQQQQ